MDEPPHDRAGDIAEGLVVVVSVIGVGPPIPRWPGVGVDISDGPSELVRKLIPED